MIPSSIRSDGDAGPSSLLSIIRLGLQAFWCTTMVFLGGCVTWLDTESLDRNVQAAAEEVARASPGPNRLQLDFVVEEDGVYEVQSTPEPTALRTVGLIGANLFGSEVRNAEKIVLYKGERLFLFVESPDPVSSLRVLLHHDRTSEVVEEQPPAIDLINLGSSIHARRSRLASHKLRSMVDHVVRSPTEYEVGGSTISASSMAGSQALGFLLFPPVEIGRIVSRVLGARLEVPTGYEETVVSRSEVPTGEVLTLRHGFGGTKLRFKLTWGKNGVAEAVVEIPENGLFRIPIEEHQAALLKDVDINRFGKLEVEDLSSSVITEQSIDIMQITGQMDKMRSTAKDGR